MRHTSQVLLNISLSDQTRLRESFPHRTSKLIVSCLTHVRLPYGNLKELMDPNMSRRIASPMTQMLDQIEKANSSYAKQGFLQPQHGTATSKTSIDFQVLNYNANLRFSNDTIENEDDVEALYQ